MKNILTVDDSSTLRRMVRYSLEQGGYGVCEAAEGREALAALEENPVHLVITDLSMPGMDGLSLIRELRSRERFRFLPILMLTTEGQDEAKRSGQEAGATGWMVKPFEPAQLLGVVRKLLG